MKSEAHVLSHPLQPCQNEVSCTERMDVGDGLGSGEEIYQLGRSEQAARPTLSSPGEGLFAKDPRCFQPYERSVRTLGSYSVATGDGLAIHDWMIRQILDNTNRHRLAARVDKLKHLLRSRVQGSSRTGQGRQELRVLSSRRA
jgi:hypothetical protein